VAKIEKFLSERAGRVKESGIRRIFNLAATLKEPYNFSIGQPDFDVPEPVKQAAIKAIQDGHNGYTVTAGLPELREKLAIRLKPYYQDNCDILVCSGVSGGLLLSLMATVNPGDEIIYPDPYFVSYPNLVQWMDGTAVPVSTYPNFHVSPERIEGAVTDKTKALLINSPNNPTGVVYDATAMKQLCQIAEKHDLLIISDEIYYDLCFDGAVPSPIEYAPQRTIVIRGFGKSYGMTGWRMGYVAGPEALISQMANMQQYTFVCSPSMVQHAGIVALDTDISKHVNDYREKRDLVAAEMKDHFEFTQPSGGFYFFVKTPPGYKNGTQFVEQALKNNVLCVPGGVFSLQDTHFRISYATDDNSIIKGCAILRSMAKK